MKTLLILGVAAGLAAGCSRSEPSQPDLDREASASQPGATDAAAASADTGAVATSSAPQTAPGQQPPAARATSSSAVATGGSEAPPPPAEPKPPAPTFREVTIPAGTTLNVTMLSPLASKTSKAEDAVKGALAESVSVGGTAALPKGAELTGTVIEAKDSGRVKGKASVSFAFDRLAALGETHRIETAPVVIEADDKKTDDLKRGGIGAGVGAVVGGIAGGGTGAAIGAVAGGAGTVLATKGRDVEVAPGTVVQVLMQSAMTVRVRIE